jgi:hypothetical protein
MRTILALTLSLLAAPAFAQTWQCFSGNVACAPGSPNCVCTPAVAPMALPSPVTTTPACPIMTYWNGFTCQVPAATTVPDPSYYLLQQQLLQQQLQRQQWQMEHHDHPDHPH